jgi:hypothetical protein
VFRIFFAQRQVERLVPDSFSALLRKIDAGSGSSRCLRGKKALYRLRTGFLDSDVHNPTHVSKSSRITRRYAAAKDEAINKVIIPTMDTGSIPPVAFDVVDVHADGDKVRVIDVRQINIPAADESWIRQVVLSSEHLAAIDPIAQEEL